MMATYFHGGSEIQAAAAAGGGGDQNLQTLYLMNPNFIAATYSDAQITCTPPNMLFLNPSNNALSQGNLPHAPPLPPPPQQQQFIGIPLGGSHPSDDHGRPSPSSSCSLQHQIPAGNLHGLSSVSRVHPNLWNPANNPIRPSQSESGPIPPNGPDMGDPMGFRRPMATTQGLSLSLSPGMQMQPSQSQVAVTLAGGSSTNGVIPGSKYLKAAQQLLEEVVNVGSNFNSITNFNNHDKPDNGNNDNNNGVGDNRRGDSSGDHKDKGKSASRDQSGVAGEGLSHGSSINVGGESSSGGSLKASELSTAQRQELQMKKAKLLSMLDEVEQRYRQYNTQMQVVVSSFEQAAGSGSAKLYTSLALKTISKQFRCLKDAILCQIKDTSKSLGEEGSNANTGVKLEGHQGGAGSRLRLVDHQLRQQRALQQLGMMQHNAWRPQRGLPERAVSVLRAWLFEHFLHPYPKDSDKIMLAKQTGLTRSQVSNWFINARVRLWKPMVEDMYLEEMKTTQEQKSGNNSEDNTNTNTWSTNNNNKMSKNETFTTKETGVAQQDQGSIMQAAQQPQQAGHGHSHSHTTNDMISNMCATSSQGFTMIGASSDMESLMGRSPKKQRSNSDIQNNSPSSILSMDMEMKAVDHHHQQRHSFMMTNHHGDGDADAGTGFNPYIVNDMAGRFNPDQMTYNGNAVSLTLGLPRCDSLSLGNPHQNFIPNHQGIPLGRRLDMGGAGDPDFCGNNMAQPSHPTNHAAAYETIDLQNRKRFAAQILHDFVASQ